MYVSFYYGIGVKRMIREEKMIYAMKLIRRNKLNSQQFYIF